MSQVDACMAAANRPVFQTAAMTANLRAANLQPMDRARLDTSIGQLVDLLGACERIFKSPVPLVYTRHTARFLTAFLILLPLGLWPVMGGSWNHWATIPTSVTIAFFLFGIEEIGIQIEEPFSILPLEALCNGAIAAAMEEVSSATEGGKFDPNFDIDEVVGVYQQMKAERPASDTPPQASAPPPTGLGATRDPSPSL